MHDATKLLANTIRALRDCSAILQSEASREGRRYKVDGRVLSVKEALDAADAALFEVREMMNDR